jgi:hypothetical protein
MQEQRSVGPATEAQLRALRSLGIAVDPSQSLTLEDAAKMLGAVPFPEALRAICEATTTSESLTSSDRG